MRLVWCSYTNREIVMRYLTALGLLACLPTNVLAQDKGAREGAHFAALVWRYENCGVRPNTATMRSLSERIERHDAGRWVDYGIRRIEMEVDRRGEKAVCEKLRAALGASSARFGGRSLTFRRVCGNSRGHAKAGLIFEDLLGG